MTCHAFTSSPSGGSTRERIQIVPAASGKTAPPAWNEANDCTVRSLANVTSLSYEQAHQTLREVGRTHRNGCHQIKLQHAYVRCGAMRIRHFGEIVDYAKSFGLYGECSLRGMTVGRSLDGPYATGKHIMFIKGHAFAVIDGTIRDPEMVPKSARVLSVYSF